MNADKAQKIVEAIETLILARFGKPAKYDLIPDELYGDELNVLFDARVNLRQILVYGE